MKRVSHTGNLSFSCRTFVKALGTKIRPKPGSLCQARARLKWMSRSAGVSTSRALFRDATAKDLLVPASLLRAPRARISLRVSSRIATLAPVVSAAATGRFALLHRVVAVSASTASGRLPAGASPHVACVTSLSPRRDRSASAHVSSRAGAFARAETRARRAGVVLAASRAAFGAFAAGASADSGAPDARSATDESRISPATTMTSATTRVVVWFRNDLRLADNYVIKRAEALAAADPGVEVLPVYCFDPRCFERSAWGSPKTGAHRARFLRECVADLQSNLRLIGSDLLVVVGKPEEVIAPLVLGDGKTTVVLTQVRSRYVLRIRAENVSRDEERREEEDLFRFRFLLSPSRRASPVRMII